MQVRKIAKEVFCMRTSTMKRTAIIAACVGVCISSGIGLVSVRSFAEKSAGGGGSEADSVAAYIPSVGHTINVEDDTVVDSVDDIPEKYQTVANYVYDQLAYGLQPDVTTPAPPSNAASTRHQTDDGSCTVDVIRYSMTASDGVSNGNVDAGDDTTETSGNAKATMTSDAAEVGFDSKSADAPDDGNGNVTWSIIRRKSDSRIVAIIAGDCDE